MRKHKVPAINPDYGQLNSIQSNLESFYPWLIFISPMMSSLHLILIAKNENSPLNHIRRPLESKLSCENCVKENTACMPVGQLRPKKKGLVLRRIAHGLTRGREGGD